MTDFYDTAERKERVILIGSLSRRKTGEGRSSSGYFPGWAGGTGGDCRCRDSGAADPEPGGMHPGTYIGKGKLEELGEMIHSLKADTVVCDDELSPAQIGNLQEELQCKVIDRTVMILDIFAAHAGTSEGQASGGTGAQLKYRASRLTRSGQIAVPDQRRCGEALGDRHQRAGREETGDGWRLIKRPYLHVELSSLKM